MGVSTPVTQPLPPGAEQTAVLKTVSDELADKVSLSRKRINS